MLQCWEEKSALGTGWTMICCYHKVWIWFPRTVKKQECIPVGCVPPTALAIRGGLHQTPPPPRAGTTWDPAHPPGRSPLNFPLGCGPGPDPPQLRPWVWAWTRSPSTSPLAVDLDQIPLHFPLGCGPGDPPQRPAARLAGTPPAMHAGTAPPETCCKACWDTTCNACWDSTHPPVDRILDTRFWKYYLAPNFVCGR